MGPGLFGRRLSSIRRLPIRRRLLAAFFLILGCMGCVVLSVAGQLLVFRDAINVIDQTQLQQRRMLEEIASAYEALGGTALALLTNPEDELAVERAHSIRTDIDQVLVTIREVVGTLFTGMAPDFRRGVESDLFNVGLYHERLLNVLDALRRDRSIDTYLAFSAVADQAGAQLRNIESDLDEVIALKTGLLRRQVNRLIVVSGGLFFVAMVLGVGLSLVIARSLTGPIRALSVAAGRMAAGDFDAAVPASPEFGARDELAALGASFGTMAGALKAQVGQLRELNDTLETRVAERTVELARRNAELDTFTYTVSHDLKSPVVALQGLLSILIEDYGGRFDDEGRRYLDRLIANTTHMSRLIEDLLALSRVGRSAGRCEPVAVRELIEDVLAFHSDAIRTRGIRIESPVLPTLMADRVLLRQVFQNLLSNAIKFLGDQPAPVIAVECRDEGPLVRFAVRDNGIGIEPAFHDKVFVIFQRLQDLDVEGTGVGLAIVKKIVEQVGGTVALQSAKGQGAVFSFTWPRATASAAALAA
ncbi:MAG: ATP-binding protein [Nitrospiria bacterium]